jgi:hypothetical protein
VFLPTIDDRATAQTFVEACPDVEHAASERHVAPIPDAPEVSAFEPKWGLAIED